MSVTKRQAKPNLTLNEIQDEVIRKNFEKLQEYFEAQNQLQDFQFVEISTDTEQTNLKVRHSLGFVPKDVIRTKVVGAGQITFNHDKFDRETIDVTTTGQVRFRGFIGTYKDDTSTVVDEDTETL